MPNADKYQIVTAPIPVANGDPVKAATEYWTEDRKAKARPLPLPSVNLASIQAAQWAAGGAMIAQGIQDLAAPVHVQPVPPDGVPQTVAGAVTKRVTDITANPYSVVVKLFMRFPAGDYIGTGWVIGERAIISAGHCMYDHTLGGWATNVVAHARYHNGNEAAEWVLTQRSALKEWVDTRNFEFDVSAGIASTPIRPITGKAGYIANQPADQAPFLSVGYPGTSTPTFPFNGEEMWESTGGFQPPPWTGVVAMDNHMTGGCSGGPWFTSKPGGGPVACGLNSFILDFPPNKMHSPYFGPAFVRIVQWITDNGGDA